LIFTEVGKPENPEKYPRSEREIINYELDSHMTPSPGIEPGVTVVRCKRPNRYATHAPTF
jgi:hypothetical protein